MVRAIVVNEFGPPENLVLEDVAVPSLAADQVLIDVHATSLSFPDLLMAAGKYQARPERPFVLGRDAAGVVAEVGAEVTHCEPGDRVFAQVQKGALAERLAAPEGRCFAIPDSLDFATAAAMVTPYNTAYVATVIRGRVEPGETVLVGGAAGGVGLAAIQLCKAKGAKVIAGIAGSEKAAFVKENGADEVVDLALPDLRDALRDQVFAVNGGRGVDVVMDPLGGDFFDAAMRTLAFAGRLVAIGFASGRMPEAKVSYMLLKNLAVLGSPVDIHFDHRPELMRQGVAELFALYEAGKLHPQVMARFPLEQIHEAARLIEERQLKGRIVMTMGREA
jgi:NADPH2:quinone reductase